MNDRIRVLTNEKGLVISVTPENPPPAAILNSWHEYFIEKNSCQAVPRVGDEYVKGV